MNFPVGATSLDSFLKAYKTLEQRKIFLYEWFDDSYLYSMCQPMPNGFCRRCNIHTETSRFTPRQNKTRSFENMVMFYFQRTRPDFEIETFYKKRRQKKTDRFRVAGFYSHCNTVFEAMGCFYHFCLCQELRPSLTPGVIRRGSKKNEIDELRRF